MRGTVTRLSRLEAKRGPKADARFYVFGVDESDTEARTAAEISKGAVGPDAPIRQVIWRDAYALPTPRWLAAGDMDDSSLDDAIAALALAQGRPIHQRGELKDATLDAEILAVRTLIASLPVGATH